VQARQVVERVRPEERVPAREVPTEVRNGTGYRGDDRRGKAESLPCAVTGLCQKIAGTQ
jgi:hypothetical protein